MIKKRDYEELQARAAKLEEQLAGYQGKEKAIVEALTEAQDTASRRVREAEDQARSIVYEAEKRREALIVENETLEREGKEKASAIIAEAEEQAKARLEAAGAEAEAIRKKAEEEADLSRRETEAAMREYTARLNALNGALTAAANTARQQAMAYAAALEAQVLPEGETVPDTAGLAAEEPAEEGKAAPMPEEYESPAQLMQSIFRLQGREGPEDVALEIEIDPEELGEDVAVEIEMLPDEEEPEILPPRKETKAEPEPEEEVPEERLWTVDEVLAAAPKPAETEAPPVDLNALLDDIMKEK